jgi:DNA (cytosine-5)-methyltransferase 1
MIKVFTLFAGYGTDNFALKRLGIDYELVGYSEIDKYACQCFKQNHGGKNYGNIREINPNEIPDMDLLTGGFPCQSFSCAGHMKGELDTRGTLFYEIVRIAEVKQPKYMLLENVKGLTFKKFKPTFDKILSELDRIGYKVYWKILNSKEHGTPQNRERVWFVCIRKDINQEFNFPEKEELNIFIKDLLEEEPAEKYYLKESQVKTLMDRFEKKGKTIKLENNNNITNVSPREVGFQSESPSLLARDYKDPKVVLYDAKTLGENEEVCHTIRAGEGSGNKIFVMYCYNHKIKINGISITLTNSCNNNLRIGVVRGREDGQQLEPRYDGCSNALTSVQKDNYVMNDMVLRKLTPCEVFRLMGFYYDEINLEGLSDTQKYKLAGNGQDVNVVSKILRNLICYKEE